AAATLGVVLLVASLWQARSVWRLLALVLVVLLAGAEWAMLLGLREPAYTGPVAAGQTFPEFATARADGTPFTRRDLEGGPDDVPGGPARQGSLAVPHARGHRPAVP